MSDLYAELLLETAKNPSHYGLLKQYTTDAKNFNASCGDEITVTIQLDGDVLVDIGWVGHGCVISRAHMSALADLVIGRKVTEILSMQKKDLLSFFGFDDTMSPGREKCLLIGLLTIQAALETN